MMKRNLIVLLAAVILIVSTVPVSAGAEYYYGGTDWCVTFSGAQMVSNFKTSDMDDTIHAMQPGDTVLFRVALRSVYSGSTSWYMENKVLKSLEDSRSVASGGAYKYILTYTNSKGVTRTLYNSDRVGGEGVTAAGDEGLHQATVSLKNFFFLDNIEKNQAGYVTLQVHLEGETQGNDYQNTLAELQMRFAVELNAVTPSNPTFPEETTKSTTSTTPTTPTSSTNPTNPSNPTNPTTPTTPTSPTMPTSPTTQPTFPGTPSYPVVEEEEPPIKPVYVQNPKTNDVSLVMTSSAIMLVSGGAMLFLAVFLWRKREEDAA